MSQENITFYTKIYTMELQQIQQTKIERWWGMSQRHRKKKLRQECKPQIRQIRQIRPSGAIYVQ